MGKKRSLSPGARPSVRSVAAQEQLEGGHTLNPLSHDQLAVLVKAVVLLLFSPLPCVVQFVCL